MCQFSWVEVGTTVCPLCKSQHSVGGICITLRAIASSGVFLSANCLPRRAVQIPPTECWDLHFNRVIAKKSPAYFPNLHVNATGTVVLIFQTWILFLMWREKET